MILTKVISGGQIGADIAALRAAKEFGIPTGGTMPHGWTIISGNKPEYETEYGMVECKNYGYPARTEANVIEADGTIRFAYDWHSFGEKCTLKYLTKYNKTYRNIHLDRGTGTIALANGSESAYTTAMWIIRNDIQILNVAGNAETRIERAVHDYMLAVFAELTRTGTAVST